MDQKILVAFIFMFLLSPIYSMSDDGGNVPVVKNENNSQEVSQVEQQSNLVFDQTAEAKSNETVKDRLGFDTNMSQVELEEFKINYYEKAKEVGLPEGRDGYNSYFKLKLNLNSYEELKRNGVDIMLYGFPTSKSHLENAIYSDVVLIGEIIDRTYVDNEKFYKSFYKVKVIEVLKGKEFIESLNYEISVLSKNGKNFFSSDETEMNVGEKRLFFLNYKLGEEDRFATIAKSERLIKGDNLYSSSGKTLLGDLKSEIEKLKKIIQINDSNNFYKRKYIKEVEK